MVRLVVPHSEGFVKGVFCFNSYMVRLVAYMPANLHLWDPCFNSYMVRLVVWWGSCHIEFQKCFNSYMVRLVVPGGINRTIRRFRFQFLYGAIGGKARKEASGIPPKFQFL